MAQARIYEGTPEQLAKHLSRLSHSTKYKMTVTPDPNSVTPANEEALTMLRDIAQMKKNMKQTEGTETDQLLRKARDGAMYGAGRTD